MLPPMKTIAIHAATTMMVLAVPTSEEPKRA